jgi:hypothetical protein
MITYPVDVVNSRFSVKDGVTTKRGCLWPRADGQPLVSVSPSVVVLQEFVGAQPAYNPATQKLVPGWVDDVQNQTATWTYAIVALDANEITEYNVEQARLAKRANLNAAAIATLRDWANQSRATTVTSGNAVATLQTVVNRLGTFFDRFADLLEVQRFG